MAKIAISDLVERAKKHERNDCFIGFEFTDEDVSNVKTQIKEGKTKDEAIEEILNGIIRDIFEPYSDTEIKAYMMTRFGVRDGERCFDETCYKDLQTCYLYEDIDKIIDDWLSTEKCMDNNFYSNL